MYTITTCIRYDMKLIASLYGCFSIDNMKLITLCTINNNII